MEVRRNDSSGSASNGEFITDESNEYENQTQVKNTEYRVLCQSYDFEVIKQKGYHPKFVIIVLHAIFLLVVLIDIFVFGYGTNWNYYVFLPIILGAIMLSGDLFYKLGKTQQQVENLQKTKFFIMYQTIGMILGTGGHINAVVIKTPFNDPALFLAGVYPVQFLVFIMIIITQDKVDTPSWLPQYRQPIYPYQTKNKFSQKNIAKDEFQIYKKLIWLSFVLTTMNVDVFSDIYFGADLIINYSGKNLFLLVVGIIILLCCFADLVLVSLMMLFPNWVSYTSHLIAFIMEIPNAVLTVISLWKIYQIGQFTEENRIIWQLAIFSFVTTALDALIHIMYIIDRWTVHNALLVLQQM